MTNGPSLQELIPRNHCWGCGPDNEQGLQLKSYWDGDGAVSIWQPRPPFFAGPTHILNGGVVASLIDCHSVCTAIAAAYRTSTRCRLASRLDEALKGVSFIVAASGFLVVCIFGSYLTSEWTYWMAAFLVRYSDLYGEEAAVVVEQAAPLHPGPGAREPAMRPANA